MNIAKVLLTQVAVVMVAVVVTPVAVAPAVVNRIQPVMGRIHIIQLPFGIKVHAHVHGHTVIHVILDITAVGAVVQNVLHHTHRVVAMVQRYQIVINRVRVHAQNRHVPQGQTVHTAMNIHTVLNITVVHVMLPHQHVR